MRNKTSTWIFFFLFVLTASGVFAAMVENSHQGLPAISVTSHPAFSLENSEQRQGLSRVLLELMSGGAFISKDPIGFNGGYNLYRYADNNPILFTDPFGLLTKAECEALKKEILKQQNNLRLLYDMHQHYKVGETWATHGLSDLSTAIGYRSEAFYAMPLIAQNIANEVIYESPAMIAACLALFTVNVPIMGIDAKIFLNNSFYHTTVHTWIGVEKLRTLTFIGALKRAYEEECKDECENK